MNVNPYDASFLPYHILDQFKAAAIVETLLKGDINNNAAAVLALRDPKGRNWEVVKKALGEAATPLVSPLLQLLTHADRFVRQEAADLLGMVGDQKAAGPLVELLSDPWVGCRQAAAIALGELQYDQATDQLRAMLSDTEFVVRAAAASALGDLGNKRAVPDLISALEDPDGYCRGEVCTALGELGDRSAVPSLIRCLTGDYDWNVRANAAKALGAIGDCSSIPHLASTYSPYSSPDWWAAQAGIVEGLRMLCGRSDSIGIVSELLERKPSCQMALNEAFTKLRDRVDADPSVVKAWVALLKRPQVSARRTAAWVLVRIGNHQVVDSLVRALTDKDEEVRDLIAQALGNVRDPRAVSGLIAELKRPEVSARRTAARVLARIGNHQVVDSLVRALTDKDEEVRDLIAQALGDIRDPRAVSGLIAALADALEVKRRQVGPWGAFGSQVHIRACQRFIEVLQHIVDRSCWTRKGLDHLRRLAIWEDAQSLVIPALQGGVIVWKAAARRWPWSKVPASIKTPLRALAKSAVRLMRASKP